MKSKLHTSVTGEFKLLIPSGIGIAKETGQRYLFWVEADSEADVKQKLSRLVTVLADAIDELFREEETG
jgi:hypothetical protein